MEQRTEHKIFLLLTLFETKVYNTKVLKGTCIIKFLSHPSEILLFTCSIQWRTHRIKISM